MSNQAKVADPLKVPDPAVGAAILQEFEIETWEEIADLIEPWSQQFRQQVWAILPSDLRYKFKQLKARSESPLLGDIDTMQQ